MILNAKGEPYRRLTMMDAALMTQPPAKELHLIAEKLQERNILLQDAPWREPARILDQFGRPIWRDT